MAGNLTVKCFIFQTILLIFDYSRNYYDNFRPARQSDISAMYYELGLFYFDYQESDSNYIIGVNSLRLKGLKLYFI